MDDVHRHFRNSVSLREKGKAVGTHDPLGPEAYAAECALGSAQAFFVIRNADLGLCGQSTAESFIGALVGTSKISPCVRESLDRRSDDGQAYKDHQRDKPACVEYVGEAGGVEKAQHGRGVSPLHVIRISNGALQDDGAGGREDNDKNDQDDAGLDGAKSLPDFARRSAK